MIIIKRYIILSAALFLCACATETTKTSLVQTGDLFPPGDYQHNVTLEFFDGQKAKRSVSMKGVVHLTAEGQLNVTGLSPFGTTVFRLSDSGSGEPKLELFDDRLKPLAPHLLNRYAIIKKVMLEKREHMQKTIADADGKPVEIVIEDYDKKSIPRNISISGEKFKIHIEVTDYELQKSS